MKKIILSLVFILSAASFANAQSKTVSYDLVIYLPYVDKMKSLPEVVDKVNSVKGTEAIAYCEDFRCLLIRIDNNYPEKSERIFEQFKNSGISFDIKKDATIQKVLSESKMVVSPETNWQ